MITINKYLDDILFDFKEYVTSGVRLCDLKEVHFDAGNLPDYSDIHVQQLYLLRYAYAYSFEYKRMYDSLIRRMNPGMEIAVTSIGCGSMIDYWALTRVVPNRCTIRYRGIDTIDWSYRMEQRPQDDVLFRNADAVELVSKAKRLTADAYIFPKSISEFSKSDIEEICIALGEKTPLQNTVYFLFSLRTDDRSMERDTSKTNYLFQAMLDNGFVSNDNPNMYTILNKELQGQKIQTVDSDFQHPWEVVNFLTSELHTCCSRYDGQNCRPDCESRLGRWPILNCQQARWQLFEFTKEE